MSKTDATSTANDATLDLPLWPAADIKRAGWKALMEKVVKGPVKVTHHGKDQAVVLTPAQYAALVEAAAAAPSPLEVLERRFDERLAMLSRPDAAKRLQTAFEASPEQMSKLSDLPLLSG